MFKTHHTYIEEIVYKYKIRKITDHFKYLTNLKKMTIKFVEVCVPLYLKLNLERANIFCMSVTVLFG